MMDIKEKNGLGHHIVVLVAGAVAGRFVAQYIIASNDRAVIALAAIVGALGLWIVRETLSIASRQISGDERGDVCRGDSWIFLAFLSCLIYPKLSGIAELFVKGEFAAIWLGLNVVAFLYLWVSCMVWRLGGMKWSALSKTGFFLAIAATYIKLAPDAIFDVLTLKFAIAVILGWAVAASALLIAHSVKGNKSLGFKGLSIFVASAACWIWLTAAPKSSALPSEFTLNSYPKALNLKFFSNIGDAKTIRIGVNDDIRDSYHLTHPGKLSGKAVIGSNDRLTFGVAVPFYTETESAQGVAFSLQLDGKDPIWSETLNPVQNPSDRGWRDVTIDLSSYAGATVEMTLNVAGAPHGTVSTPRLLGKDAAKKNVIVILVDTLRADKLGFMGGSNGISPNLDTLAAEGVVFEKAISAAPWTEPATASLLTGMQPPQLGIAFPEVSLNAEAPTIADKMTAAGRFAVGFSGSPLISHALKFDTGFLRFDESCADHFHWRSAECMTDKVVDFLDDNGDAPFFVYAHYVDPHSRFDAPPPYHDRYAYGYAGADESVRIGEIVPFVIRAKRGQKVIVSDEDANYLEALYRGEIAYVDAEIGRLIRYLKEKGLYENTLIVVTADHGEEFMEHGIVGHIFNLHGNLLHVPLVVAGAGTVAGKRVSSPVSIADIAPTLLEYVGIAGHKYTWGKSFLAALSGGEAPDRGVVFSSRADMWNEQYSAFDGRYRFIVSEDGSRRELYDTATDPGEYANLAGRGLSVEATLASEIEKNRAWMAKNLIPKAKTESNSAEEKRRLKSLGYLGE